MAKKKTPKDKIGVVTGTRAAIIKYLLEHNAPFQDDLVAAFSIISKMIIRGYIPTPGINHQNDSEQRGRRLALDIVNEYIGDDLTAVATGNFTQPKYKECAEAATTAARMGWYLKVMAMRIVLYRQHGNSSIADAVYLPRLDLLPTIQWAPTEFKE